MVAAETGQLVNRARNETDRGVFTVQATDVPSSNLRRKTKRSKKSPKKLQIMNATLEPIHEDNAETRDWEVSEHERMSEPTSRSILASDGISNDKYTPRLDTPARRSKSMDLILDLDLLEEELDNVPDINVDTDIVTMLSGLPPRPKCKRKVLPPSVTSCYTDENNNADLNKRKRNKVLKLRKDISKTSDASKYPSAKNTQAGSVKQTLEPINEAPRPRSIADNKVRVFQLSDLSSKNSSSVPDLPSLMSQLTHERLDASHLRSLTRLSMRQGDTEDSTNTNQFENNGSLSTPRRSPVSNDTEDSTTSNRTSRSEPALRGSDLASFYHMWERDSHSRPFDKKDNGKFKLNLHRECMCAIRNCSRKCFEQRHNVLPPISSSGKIVS